jgi:hypothetical protein
LWLCSPAELYGALRWLDVPSVTADDVADLIEAADKNRDGMLDYREYMSMLQVGRRCSAPCPGHTRARARTHAHAQVLPPCLRQSQRTHNIAAHTCTCARTRTRLPQHAPVRAMQWPLKGAHRIHSPVGYPVTG